MRSFASLTQHVWGLFTSERQPGWKKLLQLFAVCCTASFISSSFLFLGLYSSLTNFPLVTLAIVASVWIALSIALFSSKCVRCFAALFVLSCGLREGRNALLTAGTGIVAAGHIQSIFHNIKVLADSITCNIEAEHFALIKHYVEAIQWIYNQLKFSNNPFKDIVSLSDEFNTFYIISDEGFKLRLNTTKQQIQSVTSYISSILAIQPYISQRLLPLMGFILIVLGTYLFIRKFVSTQSAKFKNIYITKRFIEFDEQQKNQQKPSVLPLNKKERKVYLTIPSLSLTQKEKKNIGCFFLPVFTNLCIWALFAAIDYMLYWLIFSVSKHLQELPEMEVHLKVYYQNELHWRVLKTGRKKNEDNFIINNGKVIQNNFHLKIPLFKHDCSPKPEFSLLSTWIQIGVITFFLVIFGLFSSILVQLKVLVSSSFYPNIEMTRIHYLHSKLLRYRAKPPQKNVKRKFNSFAQTLQFWFPIFKAMGTIRKKEKDMINENKV